MTPEFISPSQLPPDKSTRGVGTIGVPMRKRAGDLCLYSGLKKKKNDHKETHIHVYTFSVYIQECYTGVTHICIHMQSQLITAIEHAIHQSSELV